jgi:alpha-maltose-1-phosphate synthase
VKILTVSHFFEGHGGGIERVAAHLNDEFLQAGHQASWAASGSEVSKENSARISLKCFNPAEKLTGLPMPIPSLRAIRTLTRAVRASDAVVIHDSLYLTSVAAAVLARASGKPTLLIQHISDISFSSRAMRIAMRIANWMVTRPMIASANHLVFISDEVRRKLLGEPANRGFKLLYNGVDRSTFFPAVGSRAADAARIRYGIPINVPVLLFVGRFVQKKGLAVLRALAVRRADLHFVLVGQGPINPQSWGQPNVQVLGQQAQQAIGALYRAVDLLILPSIGEGFPLVVQEAMACGLPVICGTDSANADPGASQWLRSVDIELTDAYESAVRCAAAIDQLLKFPIDTAQMAQYAADKYSWSFMAKEILACFAPSAD